MLSLEINQENSAFGETDMFRAAETARILRALADKVEAGCTDCAIMDANGNRVGTMATT